MSDEPLEDLAVRKELEALREHGVTNQRLLGARALVSLFIANVDVHQNVPDEVMASLMRTTLIRVADLARRRALVDLPHAFKPQNLPVFQAAGAAELLKLRSDESEDLFQTAFRDRRKEVDWESIKGKEHNQGPANETLIRASVWLGSIGAHNARRAQKKMLEAFASTLRDYLADVSVRQEMRSFVDAQRSRLDNASSVDEVAQSDGTSSSYIDPRRPDQTPRNRVVRPAATDAHLQQALGRLAETMWADLEDAQRVDRVNDPFPMPVRWATTDSYPADHAGNIWGDRTGSRPVEISGMIDEVSDLIEKVPSKRLVILGPEGAGKSVLVRALALALLEHREPGQPVPYIFRLYSWNPTTESLYEWMAKQLLEDHPALKAKADKTTLAARLIRAHCIVPILDGLDEMSSEARNAVIPALNTSLGSIDEVIVTSRPDEYVEAIDAAQRALANAAVVELQSLTPADLADYQPPTARLLPGSDNHTKWEPVLARLRSATQSDQALPLADALKTPLMTSLARAVYSDTDRDPAELLHAEKFPDIQAISDHLLDSFIKVKYDDIPLAEQSVRKGKIRARSAERWLGFLAVMLFSENRRGFAWWKFHMRPSRFNALAYVLPSALGLVGFGICVIGLLQGQEPDKRLVFAGSILTFAGFACMWLTFATLGGMKTFPRKFGRPGRWWRGKYPGISVREVRRGTIPGHELAALTICAFAAGSWTMVTRPSGLTADWRLLVSNSIVLAVAVVTAPIVLTTVQPGLIDFSSPAQLFRQDRRASILRGAYYGIFASLLCMAIWLPFGETRWLFLIPVMVLIGIGAGALSSCSGIWSLRQAGFAVAGRLPVRLLTFMEDAHSRGVLHQVGGVYQFKHGSLQGRLAVNYVKKLRKSIAQTPTMIRTRWIMIGSFHTSGRSDVAETMIEDLLEDLRQKYGPYHIVTLIVWRALATIRLDCGDLKQAQKILDVVNEGSYSPGVSAGGSHAPVVKSSWRASSLSWPHLVAVSR